MRRWNASLAGLLAAGALVLSGCGSADAGNEGDSAHSMAPTSPPTSTEEAGHNAADVMFAQMMIPHHKQAVRMAGLADGKAGPEVTRLAAGIKKAQGPEITLMSGWLKSWGEPATMGHDMGGMDHGTDHGDGMMSDADMKRLGTKSGAAFDRMFLTMMIKHHEGAVTMARTERKAGAYPAAKSLASSIITTQTAEIAKMRRLLKDG